MDKSQTDTTVTNEKDELWELQNIEAAIEAILYAAGHPVEYKRIAAVLGISSEEVRMLVLNMASEYNREDSPRGLNLLAFDSSCQLCTKERFAPYIREALGIKRGGNLSTSSLEVLSIIAYNQPVTRAFVDSVRGVDSSHVISSLIDKELIAAVGRLEAPGRPSIYGTTAKFLRVFGINSLSELPPADKLISAEEEATLKNTASDVTPDTARSDA